MVRTKFVGPFALMSNQPTVITTPSSNAFIRTASSANSSGKKPIHVCYTICFVTIKYFLTILLNVFIGLPTRADMNTSDTGTRSRTRSNIEATSFDPVTPVNGTRRQPSPLTDVSNGKFLNKHVANTRNFDIFKFSFTYVLDDVYSFFAHPTQFGWLS